jgi:hypothetical protein
MMTRSPSLPNAQHHANAALAWLQRSLEVTHRQGCAHSYTPLLGWKGAYPETTGYIIETFFDYAHLLKRDDLYKDALSCTDWLCTVQLSSGAFPGLLVGNDKPSIFNTGQILFGLARTVQENPEHDKARIAMERAVHWLESVLEPDGSWRQGAYVAGFTPSYYTRAIMGVVYANQVLQDKSVNDNMNRALDFYATRFTPQHTIKDWGFWSGKPAFTHTIAYTLEGFWESARLLKREDILEKTKHVTQKMIGVRNANGKTAGSYDDTLKGNYSFICLTGNAQLSLTCSRIAEYTQDSSFKEAAADFLSEVLKHHYLKENKDLYGALAGSAPLWGDYMRFRYPNWAPKFFLDALRYFL